MLITINDQPIALGEALDAKVRDTAGLRRPGLWQRLRHGHGPGVVGYEVRNCLAVCFGGAFDLYPCTHGYLTPDRQWRTDAQVLVRNDLVTNAELRVIDGRYAASEFVHRFHESCNALLGEALAVDRYTARWRNGSAAVTSILRPDTKNASFLFEMV